MNPLFLIYIVFLIAMIYFLIVVPSKKRKKKQEYVNNSLTVGTKIITIGGFIGNIVEINDTTFIIESAGTNLEVSKKAFSDVISETSEEETNFEEEANFEEEKQEEIENTFESE